VQSYVIPKRQLLVQKRLMMLILLKSVHLFFAQLTVLPNPQNPMFYNTFQWARHPKLPPLMGASTSTCNTCSLDPLNSASKLILFGSAIFAQPTAESL